MPGSKYRSRDKFNKSALFAKTSEMVVYSLPFLCLTRPRLADRLVPCFVQLTRTSLWIRAGKNPPGSYYLGFTVSYNQYKSAFGHNTSIIYTVCVRNLIWLQYCGHRHTAVPARTLGRRVIDECANQLISKWLFTFAQSFDLCTYFVCRLCARLIFNARQRLA